MEPGSSGEILIVDDDQAFRAFVSALLTRRGFKVWEARSVRDGEQILSACRPRLIIVDYQLPDMDGVTWIGKLRTDGNDVPIAFITGHWCDHSTFNWLRNILKVSMVLQKPVDPEIFVESIDSILPMSQYQPPDRTNVAEAVDHVSIIDREIESILKKFPQSNLLSGELAKLGDLETQPESVLFGKLTHLRNMLDVEDSLRVARASYLSQLASIWANLTVLLRSLKEDPFNATAVQEVLASTHKVKGTAGSFQLTTIGKCAERLENITRAHDPHATETESEIIWSEVFRVLADGELAIIEAQELYAGDLLATVEQRARLMAVTDAEGADQLSSYQNCGDLSIATSHASALTSLGRANFDAVIIAEPFASAPDLLSFCRDLRLASANPALPLLMVSDRFATVASETLTPDKISYAGFSEVFPLHPDEAVLAEIVAEMVDYSLKSKPRVLVVDDDRALTDFIARILFLQGFSVETLNEPIHIIETLSRFEPEVVVLDVIMPGLSGYDVCREIRKHERWRDLPVLFSTAKSNQEGRVLAFRAGGDDLISKPVLKEELIARVTSYSERTRLRGNRVDSDQLTKLLSRQGLTVEAEKRMSECIALEIPFTLAFISVDAFDEVNKAFGMIAAESVLASLGSLIRGRFEPSVIKGRWAERVFALAFTDLAIEQAEQLIRLLNQEFSDLEFNAEDGATFRVSVTVGFAGAPAQGVTFNQVREAAAENLLALMREKSTA